MCYHLQFKVEKIFVFLEGLNRKKRKYCTAKRSVIQLIVLPNTMFCLYAHTSSVWLTSVLMTQWYSSLLGSSHWLAYAVQFFLAAAFLHSSSLTGQSSTTCTVDLVTSHGLLPDTEVWKIKSEISILIVNNLWVWISRGTVCLGPVYHRSSNECKQGWTRTKV